MEAVNEKIFTTFYNSHPPSVFHKTKECCATARGANSTIPLYCRGKFQQSVGRHILVGQWRRIDMQVGAKIEGVDMGCAYFRLALIIGYGRSSPPWIQGMMKRGV